MVEIYETENENDVWRKVTENQIKVVHVVTTGITQYIIYYVIMVV